MAIIILFIPLVKATASTNLIYYPISFLSCFSWFKFAYNTPLVYMMSRFHKTFWCIYNNICLIFSLMKCSKEPYKLIHFLVIFIVSHGVCFHIILVFQFFDIFLIWLVSESFKYLLIIWLVIEDNWIWNRKVVLQNEDELWHFHIDLGRVIMKIFLYLYLFFTLCYTICKIAISVNVHYVCRYWPWVPSRKWDHGPFRMEVEDLMTF